MRRGLDCSSFLVLSTSTATLLPILPLSFHRHSLPSSYFVQHPFRPKQNEKTFSQRSSIPSQQKPKAVLLIKSNNQFIIVILRHFNNFWSSIPPFPLFLCRRVRPTTPFFYPTTPSPRLSNGLNYRPTYSIDLRLDSPSPRNDQETRVSMISFILFHIFSPPPSRFALPLLASSFPHLHSNPHSLASVIPYHKK